ncbi:hypothetical protein G5I_09209 [Acromyrmex echinatior]|uniref:Uncharacterized protein n=1 Tax=Acromyrmex echinatior TaxID=103372 RepID=F4WTK4_ACREC|nr:hypothetical protein G5I_09209 [Acromyrmex echinatior]
MWMRRKDRKGEETVETKKRVRRGNQEGGKKAVVGYWQQDGEEERESVKGAGGRRRRIDDDEGEGKRRRGRSIRRRARREGRMEPISVLIRAFAVTSSSYVASPRRYRWPVEDVEAKGRPCDAPRPVARGGVFA